MKTAKMIFSSYFVYVSVCVCVYAEIPSMKKNSWKLKINRENDIQDIVYKCYAAPLPPPTPQIANLNENE